MSDATAEMSEDPPKRGKAGLILSLVFALAGAGGGFFLASSGLLPIGAKPEPEAMENEGKKAEEVTIKGQETPISDIAFVPIEPIIVSLSHRSNVQHLRFRAQLEVNAKYESEVTTLLPRVTDVLNSYLRALDVADLGDSLILAELRAQMLRRVKIVTGQGKVRDLLIMEFVLN